jgi:hypothetical protein
MAGKTFAQFPDPGDIVLCRFPEKLGTPGPKPRPALVLGVGFSGEHKDSVRVAYGTSQKVDQLRRGEFAITPMDGAAFSQSGLSYPTKFDLGNTQVLPYSDEWFAIPPNPTFGHCPKLGTLHPKLMKRAQAAFKAATRRLE